MAEAILLAVSAIGSVLLDQTVSAVLEKVSRKVDHLKELPAKIKTIEEELRMINAVIQFMGAPHLRNDVVKNWIACVRRMAYHVEDVIDKFSYEALKLREEGFLHKYVFRGTRHIKVFSKIAADVVVIEGEIKQVKELRTYWSNTDQPIKDEHADVDRQRFGGCFPELVNDDDLVGIEENRKKLTEWLCTNEGESTVVTVSGMGGLGKTTLVKNVYDREKANFPDAHAWIVVSQKYDAVHLMEKLWRQIDHTEHPDNPAVKADVYQLTEAIKTILQRKKCLIVLDDVWDSKACTHICSVFHGLQGSRIIITTRKEDVAALAPPIRRLLVQPLGSTESFKLFCKRAFHNFPGRNCPPDLVKVAGDVVESMFPEDYAISRESLVRLWVAEGFALKRDNSTPEEVAEGNLMELIGRNMLEVVERDELDRVSTCKMHDIVQDLALAVAKEERFGSANDLGEMMRIDNEVRRFSTCGWKDSTGRREAARVEFPHLRTILSLASASSSTNMVSSILSGSSYLTVLELQDSPISTLPACIGNLFNLRYISLRRTLVQSLPDTIEKLSNLQTLDIKQTKIQKLPPGIVKVDKLRHLLADRFADEKQTEFLYFVGVEAPKGISNLEELQTLETVQASKDLSVHLKKMKTLENVWIDNISAADCEDLFSALSDMPLLSSLLLNACDEKETLCFEALKPISTKLHRLIVRGGWTDGTLKCPIFQGHGKYLKYLALSWCNLGREDPLEMLASHVPDLTYLSLNRVSSAATLVLSAGCFPQLKTLVLKRMPNVKQLVIEKDAIPCIDGIYIMSLLELHMVPHGIKSLRSLKKLWLLNLHKGFKTEWTLCQMRNKMKHVPELYD
ncbi:hypothetical protein BRADI_5g03140v3 [Brachypodium distachyon]|uniref:Uncharacterized protein n=1 Tax=Brachypodium distachyon TaxID=15368 RepID=I1IW61_BRADI|nr:hypothetical protein BRADI_5g03140v3 [Brachypodium distachyon]PNT60671.1 hypothetical protein BRADI_5g03140v3 [Brachypodium distachyon]